MSPPPAAPRSMFDQPWVRFSEAARALSISEATLRRYVKRGLVRVSSPAGAVFVETQSLIELFERHANKPGLKA